MNIHTIGTMLRSIVAVAAVFASICTHSIVWADSGLVLHMTFDSDEGGVASDLSGWDNDGVVQGASWTNAGVVGGAMAFSGGTGSGDDIFVPHSDSLASMQLTREVTVSMWVKVASVPNEFPVLLAKGGRRSGADGGYEFMLNANGDNDIVFASGNCFASTRGANGGWINNHLNEWRHLVFTLDTTEWGDGVARFYVNG